MLKYCVSAVDNVFESMQHFPYIGICMYLQNRVHATFLNGLKSRLLGLISGFPFDYMNVYINNVIFQRGTCISAPLSDSLALRRADGL